MNREPLIFEQKYFHCPLQIINEHKVDSTVAAQMIDQLRKDNDTVLENLERKRDKNMADLQVLLIIDTMNINYMR